MQLSLQTSDHDAIGGLPAKWRTLVNARILVLKQLASGQLTKAGAMERLDVSLPTLNRMIQGVKEIGWAALVPKYKGVGRSADSGLSGEFLEFWKRLVEGNQRKTAPAYRLLVRLWRARQPFTFQEVEYPCIPGYEGWPGWPNIPTGWGGKGRNLYRHQPKKIELTALRHGLGRARALYGPKVLSTRVGLWHLSHIQIDDVWFDLKGHILESPKQVRPLQLGMLDLLSGSRFEHGNVPQLVRDDKTKVNLKGSDMRYLLASYLYKHGISARGTALLGEHGTALIDGNVRDILTRTFGDLIQYGDSGMLGDVQALAGMGDGRGGRGNPNHKAALESLHNLIHNELAFIPGQIGHDRDQPEIFGAIERYDEGLLKLAQRLPPEVMRLFKFRTFEWHGQLVPLVNGILDAINKREDHDLEGWAELGFITRQYRLMPESNEWVNEERLLSLPLATRNAFLSMADTDPRCWTPKRLSPHEVFEMGRAKGEIIKPPASVIAEILYHDLAQPKRLRDDGVFKIEDQEIAPGSLYFDGLITSGDGRESRLRDGETYEVVINPFDTRHLWVYSGKGAFLGISNLIKRHCRADAEGAQEAFKRSAKALAERMAPTRRRNAHLTTNETARNKHNLGVLTKHEQAKADFTQRATTLLNTSLSHDIHPTDPHHEDTDIDW